MIVKGKDFEIVTCGRLLTVTWGRYLLVVRVDKVHEVKEVGDLLSIFPVHVVEEVLNVLNEAEGEESYCPHVLQASGS